MNDAVDGAYQEIRWFHSIDLGDRVTPGFKAHDLLNKEANVVFSYPVQGRSFLDVGAWDGFFSYQAEARGAARVLATDWFCWGGPGWGTKDGFNFAHQKLKSRVDSIEIDVPNISPEAVGQHDVVLLSGVLYHVTDPLSIIRVVSKVVRECLIIETAIGLVNLKEPAMLYLPAMSYTVDPTNFWAPNPACIIAMLKTCGFSNVLVGEHPTIPLSDPVNPRCYFFATR